MGPQTSQNICEVFSFIFIVMMATKNIIFDLGGVLIDIDTGKTNEAFAKLGVPGFNNNYSLQRADTLFDDLEKGKTTEAGFYEGIRKISGVPLPDSDIRTAWNALLLSFREESLECLDRLKDKYNLFLLSNTNSIHYKAFHQNFIMQTGKKNFDDYFAKAYYSHLVGFRKPDKEIYSHALRNAGIRAEETLFVDDLLKNVEAASALGIKTYHLQPHERIEDLEW